MAEAKRYIKALSKTLGIEPSNLQTIFADLKVHINTHQYSIESMANILNKNLQDAYRNKDEKIREQAARKKENPNALKHKNKIIELYLGNEYGPGLGYKKIHQLLLESCENEEEKKKVISPSTIRLYLHKKWNIPKDRDRRTPIQATEARRQGPIF